MDKKICQSCGMPMDSKDYGTTKTKTPSDEYCHFCFKNGKFTDEGITLDGKIKKNIAIAKQFGMSDEKAKSLAESTIPGLKRWKK